jgi:hypothetical protein
VKYIAGALIYLSVKKINNQAVQPQSVAAPPDLFCDQVCETGS